MNATSSLIQAAIILKSLSKQQAARILSRLEAADIQQVLDAINTLDHVTADQISAALERLNREARRWKTEREDERDVEKLNTATEAIRSCLDGDSPGPIEPDHPFGFLVHALPMVRDHLLEDEHPKNIAIVLSTMPPEIASECMKSLEPMTRVSVLRRICELNELPQEEISQLSFTLKLRFKKMMNTPHHMQMGMQAAAELLSCSDSGSQETLLAFISQSDPDLAHKLSQSVIKIEDLETMEDSEIKILLAHVDTSCWAPTLKNAPLAVQQKILANMADRPAEMLNYEIQTIGMVDEHLQQLASQQVINCIVRLNKEGKIKLQNLAKQQTSTLFPAVGTSGHFGPELTSPIS